MRDAALQEMSPGKMCPRKTDEIGRKAAVLSGPKHLGPTGGVKEEADVQCLLSPSWWSLPIVPFWSFSAHVLMSLQHFQPRESCLSFSMEEAKISKDMRA